MWLCSVVRTDVELKSMRSTREWLTSLDDEIEQDKGEEILETETTAANSKEEKGTRKSSFPTKIVHACHVVETKNDVRSHKTRTSWLKDPRLYKVLYWWSVEFLRFTFSFNERQSTKSL